MEVMKAIRLKSAADAVAKKLASFLSISKTLFKTWLRIQFNIVFFPLRLVPAVIRIASRKYGSQQVIPSASNKHSTQPENAGGSIVSTEQPLEPKSEDVVNQVKKLRNCVAMSIDVFTGKDFFWDFPILEEKNKRYLAALREGDLEKIAAAKKAVQEHPVVHPMPRSREEYNFLMEEARSGDLRGPITVPKSQKNVKPNSISMTPLHHDAGSKLRIGSNVAITKETNVTKKAAVCNVLKPKKKVEFRLDNEETLNTTLPWEKTLRRVSDKEGISTVCCHNGTLSLENKRLRSQLMTITKKLEDVSKSSKALIKEVSKLNGQFDKLIDYNKLTDMSAKLADALKNEISQREKLEREIEEERNRMSLKLVALEELIQEEESFLDDLSCESGYEETENVCDSHDELE